MDEPQRAEQPRAAVARCDANGCPLPGTIKTEGGGCVCSCHFGAKREGWPKATAVVLRMQDLWRIAREAQCANATDTISEPAARELFRAASALGLKSTDGQKAEYREAGRHGRGFRRMHMAGQMVEQSIRAAVIAAADVIVLAETERPPQSWMDSTLAALRDMKAAA